MTETDAAALDDNRRRLTACEEPRKVSARAIGVARFDGSAERAPERLPICVYR